MNSAMQRAATMSRTQQALLDCITQNAGSPGICLQRATLRTLLWLGVDIGCQLSTLHKIAEAHRAMEASEEANEIEAILREVQQPAIAEAA